MCRSKNVHYLVIVDVQPNSVERGLEDLLPPGRNGVLDDGPVPCIPSGQQLPILPASEHVQIGGGELTDSSFVALQKNRKVCVVDNSCTE